MNLNVPAIVEKIVSGAALAVLLWFGAQVVRGVAKFLNIFADVAKMKNDMNAAHAEIRRLKGPKMADDQPSVKAVWQSKTFWAAAITALAPLIPPVGAFVAANPQAVGLVVGLVFAGLRAVTKKPIGGK
jgi:hypothetical protein